MKRIAVCATKEHLGYILYVPENFTEDTCMIIYLHGAGERGTNLDHVEVHAIPQMIHDGKEIDALVLCPQCPAEFVWNNVVRDVKKLIDDIAAEYKIKPDRISITGSSMGGYGTWEMGLTYPNFFSCIAPVSGGGMQWRCQKLINTPVLAFHGEKDDSVELINSKMMVEGVLHFGGEAKLVILEGFGHNDGIDEAYNNHDLVSWLLSHRRTDFSRVKEVCEEMF